MDVPRAVSRHQSRPSSSPPTEPVSKPRSACARRARCGPSASSTRSLNRIEHGVWGGASERERRRILRRRRDLANTTQPVADATPRPSASVPNISTSSRLGDVKRDRADTGDERVDTERLPLRNLLAHLVDRPDEPAGAEARRGRPRASRPAARSRPSARSDARDRARSRRTTRRARATATPSPDRDRPARTHGPSTSSALAVRVGRPRPARVPAVGAFGDESQQAVTLPADEHTRARLLHRAPAGIARRRRGGARRRR